MSRKMSSKMSRKPDPPRTRAAGLWISSVLFAVVLLVLLIFALQNSQHAKVSFLGWHAKLPLGVALLLAAVFGVLLVALPGTARILQLRVLARRRNRAADATPPVIAPVADPDSSVPDKSPEAPPTEALPEVPPSAPPSSDIPGQPAPPNEAPATQTRSPAPQSSETPSRVSPPPA